MRRTCIKNGNIFLKDALLKNGSVVIEGSRIASIGRGVRCGEDCRTIDAKGSFVSPGFIDCHIHGEPGKILANELKFGTTSIVVAESVAPIDALHKRIDRIKNFVKKGHLRKAVLGVRLEGPYINKRKAGAQDERYIRRPDPEELQRLVRRAGPLLKIVTVAPEMYGAGAIIELLVKDGIVASVGHSDASYEEAKAGIDRGIRHATHIFNAMRRPDEDDPGASTAALVDRRVTAEIIPDLVHVDKALLSIFLRVKERDRTVLVTDSVRAEPGSSKISRGAYRFKDGRLAGSSLHMIEAVRNVVRACGVNIVDAIRFVTTNPARLLGLGRKKGAIASGMDADIVIFDKNFKVKHTIIGGEVVFP